MLIRGTVVIETVDSEALRDNPHGDPARRALPVYLPPSYESAPERRYPVIYWLPGFAGTALGAWAPAAGAAVSADASAIQRPRKSAIMPVRRLNNLKLSGL